MRIPTSVPVLLCLFSLAMPGCKNKRKTEAPAEKPVTVREQPSPASAATPAPFPKLPAPSAAEITAAFARVFGDDLRIDRARPQSFIVGDFNGDGAEDLAVIARPVPGKLSEINSELANWTIQDADKAFVPSPDQRVVRMEEKIKPPSVTEGETVLAIIHGYGPQGWRDPAARQTYLVKHAAATLQGTAPSIGEKSIRAMHLPVETEIIQGVRDGRKGFLFWTGGGYAWHPGES